LVGRRRGDGGFAFFSGEIGESGLHKLEETFATPVQVSDGADELADEDGPAEGEMGVTH